MNAVYWFLCGVAAMWLLGRYAIRTLRLRPRQREHFLRSLNHDDFEALRLSVADEATRRGGAP